MSSSAILLTYQERILALHATAAQLRVGQMIAIGLMCVAFACAIYCGNEARRRNLALLETLRLEHFYQQGVNRFEGRWAGSGPTGEEFAPDGHRFARDLNVLGKDRFSNCL